MKLYTRSQLIISLCASVMLTAGITAFICLKVANGKKEVTGKEVQVSENEKAQSAISAAEESGKSLQTAQAAQTEGYNDNELTLAELEQNPTVIIPVSGHLNISKMLV